MSKKKSQNQMKHAIRRIKERFNIELNDNQYTQLCNRIKNKKGSIFVEKQTNRVYVYDIQIEEQTVRVVWDKHRKSIVTALNIY